ncbi:Transposase [Caenorhabditis elegans]|uniref:Transposase n=1 Tax=Caenorhabditis elegans TaxID=6239 RepID=Q10903_CAEEL|nr:Transposase [Caenorhabditis elegans]CCD61227.1 Transposase [Caenorhabditis elegans]|eukprot:NP_495188.1 Uncharacterized protein CELE_B0034.2 [Caenorhabditis elegans]
MDGWIDGAVVGGDQTRGREKELRAVFHQRWLFEGWAMEG